MSAGPYCRWCSKNCGCSKDCPGPPKTENVEVVFLYKNGKLVRKTIEKPYGMSIPELEGFEIKITDPNKQYYREK